MADKDKDGTIVLAAAIGIAVAVLAFLSRKNGTPPPGEVTPAGTISFSTPPPATMIAGSSYGATAGVTNLSNIDGTAAACTFNVRLTVKIGNINIYQNTKSLNLAAGASGNTSWNFNMPSATVGAGSAAAELLDKAGTVLNQAAATFIVSPPEQPEEPEEPEAIRTQLASAWNYIACCGSSDRTKGVWTMRGGAWKMYCHGEVDEIGYFRPGEGAWLYNVSSSPVTLTYKGNTWTLDPGWTIIGWL